MRRKSMKLVLANLALAALMSGFTCATFEQNGNRLTFVGRFYQLDTNDGLTYCGVLDAYQVSSNSGSASVQGRDERGVFRVTDGGGFGACFEGGPPASFRGVNAILQGQATCTFDETPPFGSTGARGAGQGSFTDKERNKTYTIQTRDIECADFSGGGISPP